MPCFDNCTQSRACSRGNTTGCGHLREPPGSRDTQARRRSGRSPRRGGDALPARRPEPRTARPAGSGAGGDRDSARRKAPPGRRGRRGWGRGRPAPPRFCLAAAPPSGGGAPAVPAPPAEPPGPPATGPLGPSPRGDRAWQRGRRGAAGRRNGVEAAYLAEHPAELNRQSELGLGVLLGAGGIPALVVRHGDRSRSHHRAGKEPERPPPTAAFFCRRYRSAGLYSSGCRHRAPPALASDRPATRLAAPGSPRRGPSDPARGQSHNTGTARGGGASARPPAGHPLSALPPPPS